MKITKTQSNKQWYTVTEIARHFNISESLVRIFIREKKLKHHRVGRKIIVKPSEFEETVMQTIDPAPPTIEQNPSSQNTMAGEEQKGVKD